MIQDWEAAFAPCDEAIYQFVVERVTSQDVVLDIGAGDLRLARRLAQVTQKVYAVERNTAVLPELDRRGAGWSDRLVVINADATRWPFPADVTVAILLMRHCTLDHFAQYRQRLSAETRCRRLITNARWKMDVEEIDLRSARRRPYDPAQVGWYACRCGATGFTPGDPRLIDRQVLSEVREVTGCPICRSPLTADH